MKFITLKLKEGGEVVIPRKNIRSVQYSPTGRININQGTSLPFPHPSQSNTEEYLVLTGYQPYIVKKSSYNTVKKYLLELEEETEQINDITRGRFDTFI